MVQELVPCIPDWLIGERKEWCEVTFNEKSLIFVYKKTQHKKKGVQM